MNYELYVDKTKHLTINILQIFASRSWGGGEEYVYALSKKLIEDGHTVWFVSQKSPDIVEKLRTIHSFPRVLPLLICFDLWSIIQLALMVRKNNIELIHSHQFKDALIAIFARIVSRKKVKIILTRHLVKKAKTNALYSFLYKRINAIIFVSALAKNEFLSSCPKIDEKKIFTIHNSIYPAPVIAEKTNLRASCQIGAQTVVLAFTGQIVEGKGIEILLDAVYNLKNLDIVLLIAGKGKQPYEQLLKNQTDARGLGNKIFFLGFVDNISGFIPQIDIGIAPSIWRESFGLSVIEFMKFGKPVITTNNGAQNEYITHLFDGCLISPSDVNALTGAIRLLVENREERLRIGQNAQKTFLEKLSFTEFYNKTVAVYRNK